MIGSVLGFLTSASVMNLAAWLADKVIAAFVSAFVAFAILQIGRGRELRKLSLEMYKEFYSVEFSKQRYESEKFFEKHAQYDWRTTDPYNLDDIDGTRTGYATVTRYFARLSVLYKEKELDRKFAEKILSRMAGYWWGLVYESMTERTSMYTATDLKYIFNSLRTGCRSEDFARGFKDGATRKAANRLASIALEDQATAKGSDASFVSSLDSASQQRTSEEPKP